MRTYWVMGCLAALVAMMVACGDEATSGQPQQDVSDGGTDTGRDVTTDTPVEDTVEDAVVDAQDEEGEPDADVEEEPDAPEPEAICDDGVDNDGDTQIDCADEDCAAECELICNDLLDDDDDGHIDCADIDCTDDANCGELCGNGIDDDADTDVDCDDDECADAPRCTETVTDVDSLDSPDDFSEMGYIYSLQYPTPDMPACCFDYGGLNTAPDNVLSQILLAMEDAVEGYDAQGEMDAVVNLGDVVLLVEWLNAPDPLADADPLNFNVYRGIPVSPAPVGVNTNPWDTGAGVFRVTRDSFDERGPIVRFRNGALSDGVLTTEPNFLTLTIPIEALGIALSATLFEARIEMILEDVTPPAERTDVDRIIETVPQTVSDVTFGGGKIGGYILADELYAFLNKAAEQCQCAFPLDENPATQPMIEYGEIPAPTLDYDASCVLSPFAPTNESYTCNHDSQNPPTDNPICQFLDQICSVVVPLVPDLLDVDDNKNGIDDALSVGLYFDLTGAQLDTTPITTAE